MDAILLFLCFLCLYFYIKSLNVVPSGDLHQAYRILKKAYVPAIIWLILRGISWQEGRFFINWWFYIVTAVAGLFACIGARIFDKISS